MIRKEVSRQLGEVLDVTSCMIPTISQLEVQIADGVEKQLSVGVYHHGWCELRIPVYSSFSVRLPLLQQIRETND